MSSSQRRVAVDQRRDGLRAKDLDEFLDLEWEEGLSRSNASRAPGKARSKPVNLSAHIEDYLTHYFPS